MSDQQFGRAINKLKATQQEILVSFVNKPCSDFIDYTRRVAKYGQIEADLQVIIQFNKGAEDDDGDDTAVRRK